MGAALLAQMLVYLQTPLELRWLLDTSSQRVVFQLLPATVLALARATTLHPWLGRRFGRWQEASA